MQAAPSAMLDELKKLRMNSTTADFTLASESGKEWKTHKLILGLHSDVLYRMSTSPDFMVGETFSFSFCEREGGDLRVHERIARRDNEPVSPLETRADKQTRSASKAARSSKTREATASKRSSPSSTASPSTSTSKAKTAPPLHAYSDDGLRKYIGKMHKLWEFAEMWNVKSMKQCLLQELEGYFPKRPDSRLITRLAVVMEEIYDLPKELWTPLVKKLASALKDGFVEQEFVPKVMEVMERRPEIAVDIVAELAKPRVGFFGW